MIALLATLIVQAGETSVSRVPSSEVGPAQLLRIGLDGSVSAGRVFPEPGVDHRLTRTTVRAAFTARGGWELFGSISGATFTGARLLSSQGDATLGVKWKPGGRGSWWALDAQMLFPSGLEGGFPVTNATSLTLRAIAGWKLGTWGGLDCRIDAMAGADLDRTRNLLAEGVVLTPLERYGLGIQSGAFAVGGVALSAVKGPWMPFVELSAAVPTIDATDAAPKLTIARATGGVRWAFAQGASLEAALDVGLGDPAMNALFRTAPPWEGRAGLSIAFDPIRSLGPVPPPPAPEVRTVYVDRVVPAEPVAPAPAETARLTGRVLDPSGRPLAGALVEAEGTHFATDGEGRFEAVFAPGRVGLFVKHPDFEPLTNTQELASGARVALELRMKARPAGARLVLKTAPGGGALSLRAKGDRDFTRTFDAGADVILDELTPGRWRLLVWGDEVLADVREVEPAPRQVLTLDWKTRARPEKSALSAADGWSPAAPVAFVRDSLADTAAPLLDEWADALLRSDARVRFVLLVVKGAAEAENRARARSIVHALVARGVPAAQLFSDVVGLDRPLEEGEPNVRVERLP